ncbi:MAG: glycosyltransferase [Cyanobacteria bacterium]|nr:glycosyltransferase [Cyanobacteriota bacterium]
MHNIENQSLKPNEVIIVDGGSTDKTIYEIEKFISGTRLNVKFIKGGFPNIPEGRNIGIKNSSFENIVIADAGNIINKDYARNLIGTLSKYKADLVGGIFYPVKHTKYANFFLVDWTKTNWLTFLPSTRALAIKKTLAIKCGLFPEYVNSGDDTLFDINYRKKSKKWVFNKNIVTHWQTATTKNEFEKVVRSYGKADGEDGIGDYLYWELNALNKTELPLNEPVLRKEQFRNYLDGKKNRVNIEIEKRKISGLILVFTVNQLSDYPEDSKIVILIKKYLVNNFKVFFISCSKPAFINNKKIFFDLDLTLLELSYITDFNIEHILNTYNRVIDKTIIIQESKSKMVKEIIRKTISKNKNIKIVRVS